MRRNIPAYRHHKPSGRACVTLTDATTGKRSDVYLGDYGTPESRVEYDRVIRQWLEGGRVVERAASKARKDVAGPSPATATVTDVLRAYWREVCKQYPGKHNSRRYSIRAALRSARSLFGKLPAREFGPRALRKVRDSMAGNGWKRSTVNDRLRIIVGAFKWGVEHELVKVQTWQALTAVRPLRKGDANSIEADKVLPVPLPHVEAVLPHVAGPVRALIELQLLTGARGGELCIMRPCDIDTAGKVWTYRPATHKNEHRGHDRLIYIGPKAQAVIKPFLSTRQALDDYLFSAREGAADRKAATASKGKSRRPGQAPNATRTDRKVKDRYTPGAYRKAIERGCEAANRKAIAENRKRDTFETWTPHQLRHTSATLIRREFGLEAASLVLGHSSATVTDAVYAERDGSKVSDVMLRIG
jgi:integrase